MIGSISNVFIYPLIRSREPPNTGSAPPEVKPEAKIDDESVFVSIETDEGKGLKQGSTDRQKFWKSLPHSTPPIETYTGVHDSLDTTKSDTELKILESDDSKADEEQRDGQEDHDRERSFEVKDDHQTRLKEQFTNHSNPGNLLRILQTVSQLYVLAIPFTQISRIFIKYFWVNNFRTSFSP